MRVVDFLKNRLSFIGYLQGALKTRAGSLRLAWPSRSALIYGFSCSVPFVLESVEVHWYMASASRSHLYLRVLKCIGSWLQGQNAASPGSPSRAKER